MTPTPIDRADWQAQMVAAAEEYADLLGWSVLPVHTIFPNGTCSCRRPDCPHPGKHPAIRDWQRLATNDLRQVLQWFGTEPRNLGVHVGMSGIAVTDIDGPDGLRTFRRLFGNRVTSPLVGRSGREVDGWHLYFRDPDVGLSYVKRDGIELHVGDRQVLASPSRHVSGREYSWHCGSPLADGRDLADLPEIVIEWAMAGKSTERGGKLVIVPESLPDGTRREFFLRAGGLLVDRGVRGDELYRMLDVLNQSRGKPPWPDEKLHALVDDMTDRYPTTRNMAADLKSWPELVPLDPEKSAPGFPVEVLPEWLARFCRAWAEATQTPVDAIAILALGAIATTTQGRVKVRLLPDWVEETCLYVLLVMESGTKKSPTFRTAFAPIVQAERDLREMLRDEHLHARSQLVLAEERVRATQRAAVKSHEAESDYVSAVDAKAKAEEQVAATVPPRFYADDATPEAFVELLSIHKRMTIASAEGGWFRTFAGSYTEGRVNLDSLLKGWGGEGIRVDRKGAPPIDIPEAICGVLVAVQRDVLREMVATRGVVERGLLARFVKAAPATRRGYRNVRDPAPMPEFVREEYAARVSVLLHELREHDPVELRLDEDAGRVFTEHKVHHEEVESRPGGRVHDLAEWGEKYLGTVARIAAVLHFASHDDTGDASRRPINERTMRAAIAIGDYLIEQEVALDGVARQSPEAVGARAVLDWIRARGVLDFSTREVQRAKAGRVALQTSQQVRAALQLLADHGYVARIDEGASKSELWVVNPAVFGSRSVALTPRQSRQDSPEGAPPVDTVNVSRSGEAS